MNLYARISVMEKDFDEWNKEKKIIDKKIINRNLV